MPGKPSLASWRGLTGCSEGRGGTQIALLMPMEEVEAGLGRFREMLVRRDL